MGVIFLQDQMVESSTTIKCVHRRCCAALTMLHLTSENELQVFYEGKCPMCKRTNLLVVDKESK